MAECSLPRLLFGHNGRVLEDQSQIDKALEELHSTLSVIASVPDVKTWRVWRADMAWNFDLPARAMIIAHACFRLPGIHGV